MNTAIPMRTEPEPGDPTPGLAPEAVAAAVWQQHSAASYYWRLVLRDRWRIATFVLVVTIVAALAALAMSKQYQGDASVRVDPVGVQVAGQAGQNLDRSDSELLLQTERNVITSPAILVQVIRAQHLDQDPEFKIKAGADPNGAMDQLVRQVGKKLSVDAPVGTLLLQVHYRSHDPAIAAGVANAVVSTFIDQEYKSRADALRESSKYMSAQLGAMRAAMERDQQALVDYQSQNNVLDPEDKQNIYAARLSQVNADFSAAQSARMQVESVYEAARSGNVDALIAAGVGQALPQMRQRLRDDTRQLARLATVYGDRHPLYQEQQQLVQQDQSALNLAAGQEAAQLGARLQAAEIRERLLAADVAQEKQSMDAFNQRAIRYSALKAAADSSTKLYYDLLQQIQSNNVAAGLKNEMLRVVSLARVPDRAVFPNIPLMVGVAFLLALLLGAWGSIGLAVLDNSISRPEQIEQLFGVPALGSLPQRAAQQLGAPPAAGLRTSPFDEAILSLRSVLMFALEAENGVLAVTSALPGEGKSTVASSLARSIAGMGRSVVLIDCDLRKPSVHRNLHIENRRGLASVLLGNLDLEAATVVPPGETLAVVPAGTQRVGSDILHVNIGAIIEKLRSRYDFVVVDCPPTLGFSDVAAVSRAADGMVVVVHAGATERNFLRAALRQLAATRARVFGVVLNRVDSNVDEYYGYYSNAGYASYYQEVEE